MASKVSICNLALSHLGDEATVSSIDPPEGSAQAEHCAFWYPIARDVLLESHDWRFSTARKALTLLSGLEQGAWTYAYAAPANCLSVRAILAPAAGITETEQFDIEINPATGAQVIFTDMEDAIARYTLRVDDPNRYSGLAVDALAWLLASYLAGPVLKGDAGQAAAKAAYGVYLQRHQAAAVADANQRRIDWRDETRSTFIAGR